VNPNKAKASPVLSRFRGQNAGHAAAIAVPRQGEDSSGKGHAVRRLPQAQRVFHQAQRRRRIQ
jgi:hypothetical protein